VLQSLLDRLVAAVCAVKDPASGRSRSELVECLLARRDHVGVEGHSHVVVGAKKDRATAIADGDRGAFDLVNHKVEGVRDSSFEERWALLNQRIELGK